MSIIGVLTSLSSVFANMFTNPQPLLYFTITVWAQAVILYNHLTTTAPWFFKIVGPYTPHNSPHECQGIMSTPVTFIPALLIVVYFQQILFQNCELHNKTGIMPLTRRWTPNCSLSFPPVRFYPCTIPPPLPAIALPPCTTHHVPHPTGGSKDTREGSANAWTVA